MFTSSRALRLKVKVRFVFPRAGSPQGPLCGPPSPFEACSLVRTADPTAGVLVDQDNPFAEFAHFAEEHVAEEHVAEEHVAEEHVHNRFPRSGGLEVEDVVRDESGVWRPGSVVKRPSVDNSTAPPDCRLRTTDSNTRGCRVRE